MAQEKGRLILGALSWSGLVSAVILSRLYEEPALTPTDWLLLFLASVFAGTVLGLLENIIIAFATTLILSPLIIGAVLSLPSTLGLTGPLFQQIAVARAASSAVQALFPLTMIIILIGGLIGGFVADRFGLS